MSSDWLRVALLLSEILRSIGLFSVVCKINKLVPQMFIHDHHVEDKRSNNEKDKGQDEKIVSNPEAFECFKKCYHGWKDNNVYGSKLRLTGHQCEQQLSIGG